MASILHANTPATWTDAPKGRLARLLERATVWWTESRRRRADRRFLRGYLALDEWVLDDLGLTRADVYGAIDSVADVTAADSLLRARRIAATRPLRGIRRR
ncbi:MAG: hypothetical protein KDJ77_10280 [Rhodobiaceae bacterium]|nr:hypothetical protein [Rhodobiaceae bacterium]